MKRALPPQAVTQSFSSNRLIKEILFFSLLVFFTFNSATAQNLSANYTCNQILSNPAYSALPAGKKDVITGIWDNAISAQEFLTTANPLMLGTQFAFKFNNVTQTSFYVSSNGYMTFGSAPNPATVTAPLNTTQGSGGLISVYGTDLSVQASSAANTVSYFVTADPIGSRILKIEWPLFRRSSGDTAPQMSMQLWLYETTNVIEMHYDAQTVGYTTNVTTAQVGLRGASGTAVMSDVSALLFTGTTWPANPGVMSTATAITDGVRTRSGGSANANISGSNRMFTWTPVTGCAVPASASVSNPLITSATVNITSGGNYQYYLNSTNPGTAAGTAFTAPSGTYNLTGLTAGTTYTLWVRTDCGSGSYSSYVSAGTFTTLCVALGVPYTQNFGSAANTFIPACTSRQIVSGPNQWGTANPADGSSGYATPHLMYIQDGASAANTWFYTDGLNLTGGQAYKLTYNYGGTAGGVINKMEVKYGLGPYATTMTLPLDDHPSIKGIGSSNVVVFTPPANGVYYFGFKAYSAAAQGRIYLDDIYINTTDCVRPVSVAANTITGTSASVTWGQVASPPLPSTPGYSYYVTTAGTTAGTLVAATQYQIAFVGTTDFTTVGATTSASVTASISGTVMTVTAVGSGTLAVGQGLWATGISGGQTIVNQLTGAAGGIGTYTVSISQTLGSTTIKAFTLGSTFTATGTATGTGVANIAASTPLVAAGGFVIGTQYEIVTAGSTSFTAIGAPNNSVGTYFVATGAGSGTGTAAVVLANSQTTSATLAGGINGVNLTGLAPNTTYYFWVRSSCGAGETSLWSQFYSFTTANSAGYCTPTGNRATTYLSNFSTSGGLTNINNTTTYASPSGYADYTGQVVSQIAGGSFNFNTVIAGPTVGVSIWVDWSGDITFNPAAYPTGERMYNSGASYVYSASGSITVPAGTPVGNYRMRVVVDYWAVNPNPCSINNYFGVRQGEAEDYTLYVATPPQPLTISIPTSTQCVSTNSPLVTLTAGLSDYDTFAWTPTTGVTGNQSIGWTFNNSTTTVYTLNAIKGAPFSVNSTTFTYVASPPPAAVTITPTTATVCQTGLAQLLTATGGIVSNSVALFESFETGATAWTKSNNSGASNPVTTSPAPQPAWTIRPNGYNRPPQFNSNDNSQFMFSDSDAQGSGTNTAVILESPAFSLGGYSSANLSFWHYYRNWSSSTATVEISTNGGGTYTTILATYTTVTQGSATNFTNVNIDLTTYAGQTNLKIRFKYDAVWGYYWAIDNVVVSGNKIAQFTWSPTTDLYTDALHTNAYSGGITDSVYTFATANRTYTATAAGGGTCTTTQTVAVTYVPLAGGTVSNDQTICGGFATALTVASSSGSIQWQRSPDNVTFTDISGATGTTLSSAQMGSISATTYFRTKVTNSTCTTYSGNVVTITITKVTWNAGAWSNGTGPDSTMSAEFRSNYTSSINGGPTGDLSACSVSVINGAAVLFDKGTLTVENAVAVISGTLEFDDTNFDVSLYQPNNVTNAASVFNGGNTGNITFKRTAAPMYKFDYTYWSTPVYPQNLLAVSPASPIGLFLDYTTAWHYIPDPSTTTMEVCRGYIIRAPTTYNVFPAGPNDYTASFIGVPNNGDLSIAINGGAGQFNFLGNPYPSALDANDFLNGNTNVTGTLYFWTHNTPINPVTLQYALTGDYASYNLSGGVAATNSGAGNSSQPTKYVASGQGFFIKGLTSTPAVFQNTMREPGNNSNFYKSPIATQGELAKHRYWLDITNTEGAFKQALVAYVETATQGLDRLFDGDLVELGNVISIYTKVQDTKLTIQGRALPFEISDLVPLAYKTTIASTYTITMPQYDGLFTEQHVYLEDKVLNVIHDLTEGPYTFATEIGTFEERFVLRYTDQALGTDDPVFNENSVVVYKNEQGLHVNTGNEVMKSVTIYDVRGRVLATQKQVGTTTTLFTTLPDTQQVLLVKIVGENGGEVTKKVVY